MLHHMLRAAAGRDRIPTDGLIAHWTMDSIVSGVAADDTGDYDATVEGSPSVVPGPVGNGFDFDGLDDVLRLGVIPTDDPLQLLGDFTLGVWLNWGGLGDDFQRIIDKSTSGNAADGYSFYVNTSGKLGFSFNGSAAADASNYSPIVGTLFHTFFCVTGATLEVYINNSLDKSTTSIPSRPNTQTNASIASWNHTTGREWKGLMDDMVIYNRYITADERSQIYERGL